MKQTVIPFQSVKRYIKQLNTNCSPGVDGVTSEHLKYASNSSIPLHLSQMLSLCITYGIVPDSFYQGLLIPVLKKNNIDPSLAHHYRPITVLTTFSKLLELYIIDNCHGHVFDPLQFGFIDGRGTNMAIALASDVSQYCYAQGSTTYMCSLDAEAAFDGLPHAVLFSKAIGVIPDASWQVLYYWYQRMEVYISFNNKHSAPIKIQKGTKQGGLSSTFLFNLFYQDMVHLLNSLNCGICINNCNYNVFAYADDLLLSSTTVTGLQQLIDTAVSYVTDHGLRFNSDKTKCLLFGANPFDSIPNWKMNNTSLSVESNLTYLGAEIGSNSGKIHIEKRIRCAQRAFYSLQGSGLKFRGVLPETAMLIFKTVIHSTLSYGCTAIYLNKKCINEMDKLQGKLIKTVLLYYPSYESLKG